MDRITRKKIFDLEKKVEQLQKALYLQGYNIENPNPNPNRTFIGMRSDPHPRPGEIGSTITDENGNRCYVGIGQVGSYSGSGHTQFPGYNAPHYHQPDHKWCMLCGNTMFWEANGSCTICKPYKEKWRKEDEKTKKEI